MLIWSCQGASTLEGFGCIASGAKPLLPMGTSFVKKRKLADSGILLQVPTYVMYCSADSQSAQMCEECEMQEGETNAKT